VSLPTEISKKITAIQEQQREQQMSLPFDDWVERLRAAPNKLLRSALFGVVKPGRRRYVKEMVLPMVGEFSLAYTGERLDQADEDIFLQVVHFARQRTVSDEISFPARRLLREIKRKTSGADYKWLHGRLVALAACAMTIRDGKGRTLITGGLIRDSGYDEMTGEFKCRLNPYMRGLFSEDEYTLIDWGDRLALGGKQLAKWLQRFYASHTKPHALKVATLMELCGSESADLKHFRADLRKALEELRVRGTVVRSWRIGNDDLVHVVTIPSASQARRLARGGT